MSSPLTRRTVPYVIMNNHTRSPSVAYSARPPDQESSINPENTVENLTNTLHPNDVDVTTTSLFHLVRRAQVCREFIRESKRKSIFFQNTFNFLGVSKYACCVS